MLAWAGLGTGALTLIVLGLSGAVTDRAPQVDVTLAGHRVSWVLPVLWLSIVAAVLAYVSGISAARLLGPKVSSFVALTEVLFAVGFAWLVLGQTPSSWQAAGGVLILTGAALVRVDEARSPRSLRPPVGELVGAAPGAP